MSNKVKVMRILIYEGDYEWVKIALESTEVPIEGIKKFGNNRIKSALIDKLPEIMNESNVDINNSNDNDVNSDYGDVNSRNNTERTWLDVDDIKEMTNNVMDSFTRKENL